VLLACCSGFFRYHTVLVLVNVAQFFVKSVWVCIRPYSIDGDLLALFWDSTARTHECVARHVYSRTQDLLILLLDCGDKLLRDVAFSVDWVLN